MVYRMLTEVVVTELKYQEKKWVGNYPYIILSWRTNWNDKSIFFYFSLEIRKLLIRNYYLL